MKGWGMIFYESHYVFVLTGKPTKILLLKLHTRSDESRARLALRSRADNPFSNQVKGKSQGLLFWSLPRAP